jgi:hypothetical protein
MAMSPIVADAEAACGADLSMGSAAIVSVHHIKNSLYKNFVVIEERGPS